MTFPFPEHRTCAEWQPLPPRTPQRPIPDDFEQHLHLSLDALRQHYRAGPLTVNRWLAETKSARVPLIGGKSQIERPDNYREVASTMTIAQCAEHFGVSKHVIQRWDRETKNWRARPSARSRHRPVARVNSYQTAPVDRPHIGDSVAERAAEHLRHYGPVKRCDATGAYDPNGQYWIRGSSSIPLSADEIIARAVRLKFNVDGALAS